MTIIQPLEEVRVSIITDGSRNTAIGYNSGPNANLSNTITIGYNAISDADNIARIGDASITSIGGYTTWSNLSDGRFKKNIQENVVGLDFILKLRPVTYNLDMDAIARFNNTSEKLRVSRRRNQKSLRSSNRLYSPRSRKSSSRNKF